ncbi:MAG: SDR family NAD(P)-dependent oxidoreductase [Pseudomonadota bacterium]
MTSVCVIVGAGEGLGKALAEKFSAEGMQIALISRSKPDYLTELGQIGSVEHYKADALNPEDMESTLGRVQNDFGGVDTLVYNVRGNFESCEPLQMSYEALDENFRLEVIGAFASAKSVLPAMIRRGSGNIFFSSATAAFRGSARYPVYAIGKFGLRGLSQSLAKAYGKNGVHIVHFRLDCDLDVPVMQALYADRYDPDKLAQPKDVAEIYWLTRLQSRGAWSNEVEIRPATENWTY